MKIYGFLLTLFATTTAVAIPPFYDLDHSHTAAVRTALDTKNSLSDYRDFFNAHCAGGTDENTRMLDWYTLAALRPQAMDTQASIGKRGELMELLTSNNFLTALDHFDSQTNAFNYNPALVMEKIIREGPVTVLHIGGPVPEIPLGEDGVDPTFPHENYIQGYTDLGSVFGQLTGNQRKVALQSHYRDHGKTENRFAVGLHVGEYPQKAISISNTLAHSPDILASSLDYRYFEALVRCQTGEATELSQRLNKIVLYVDNDLGIGRLPNLLHDSDFLGWVSEILSTDQSMASGLEVRGLQMTDGLKQRLAPYGFRYLSHDTETDIHCFVKLPSAVIDTIPSDFDHTAHANANAGVRTPLQMGPRPKIASTPHTGASSEERTPTKTVPSANSHIASPVKQRGYSRTEFMSASETAFIGSGGTHAFKQGVPRGFSTRKFLLNPEILAHIVSEIEVGEPPHFESYLHNFNGWMETYGQWVIAAHAKATDVFLEAFEPNSQLSHFKGLAFLEGVPVDLNWLDFLGRNPQAFLDILGQYPYLQFKEAVNPPTNSGEAMAYVTALDDHMDAANQKSLAVEVCKLVFKSIANFGTLQTTRFYPWKPTLPGFDLNVFEQNIRQGNFFGQCGDLRYRFMEEHGFSEDDMAHPLAKMSYLSWIQDVADSYATHTADIGYSYLPHMPPGAVAGVYHHRLLPLFSEAVRNLGADDLPDAFQFEVLGRFPDLERYLGGEERTFCKKPLTFDNAGLVDLGSTEPGTEVTLQIAENRRMFHLWAQLRILESVHIEGNEGDFCWHPMTSDQTPEYFGWKALRDHNPSVVGEYDAWFEAHKPSPQTPTGFLSRTRELDENGGGPSGDFDGENVAAAGSAAQPTLDAEVEARIKKAWFPSWIQMKWGEGLSTGQRGMNCRPGLDPDFDSVQFIQDNRNSPPMAEHWTTVQRLQRGELRGGELIQAVYEITGSAEQQALLVKQQQGREREAATAEREAEMAAAASEWHSNERGRLQERDLEQGGAPTTPTVTLQAEGGRASEGTGLLTGKDTKKGCGC